jgi:hypothetical protein
MMRQATIDKRVTPIETWIRQYKAERGVPPTLNKVWERCHQACYRDGVPRRYENARTIYAHLMNRFA